MTARWRDDVAAIAAHIDSGADSPAGVVRDLTVGMSEVQMHPVPGSYRVGSGETAMTIDEFAHGAVATAAPVDVDNDEIADVASTDGDVGVRPLPPPTFDGGAVGGGAGQSV